MPLYQDFFLLTAADKLHLVTLEKEETVKNSTAMQEAFPRGITIFVSRGWSGYIQLQQPIPLAKCSTHSTAALPQSFQNHVRLNMLLSVYHLIQICFSSNQLIYFSKCSLFKRILLQCCYFIPELLCYHFLINHCFASCEVSFLSTNDSFWIWFDNCFSCLLTIFSLEVALSLLLQLECYPFS